MPFPSDLKALLACPKCKGSLLYPDSGQEIHCVACKLIFRLENDVPIMLIEEAEPLNEPE